MAWTDRFTEMVVGRGLADQLERARLEKMYEGVEQRLKQTADIAYEPRLDLATQDKSTDYLSHRTESLPLEFPQEGTLRPRRAKLQRSQSEIGNTTRPGTTSPSGPPDITAIDVTHDHLHRAYSQADVCPRRSTRMPPLEQMTGFGKYRRSIHADHEWQMQQYRANLCDIPGLVAQLGDFKLADPDPVVWDRFCEENARSSSFASSMTSHSRSSEGPTDGSTDRRTGPVVTRGFIPSTTSSAASSLLDSSSGHERKDSGMSMTSPSNESHHKLVRFPSRQSTLPLLGEPTALTAINEHLAGDRHQGCKVSQFLKCPHEGDMDNAVESEYDDDSEADANQMDGHGPLMLRPVEVGHPKLAQKAPVDRVKRRISNPTKPHENRGGLERSTTVIRKAVRPTLRRTMSRGKPAGCKRAVSTENAPLSGKKFNSTALHSRDRTSYALTSSDKSMEAHEHLDRLERLVAHAQIATVYHIVDKEDPQGSFESDTTMHTLTADITSNLPAKFVTRTRRNRSHTALRIDSETT